MLHAFDKVVTQTGPRMETQVVGPKTGPGLTVTRTRTGVTFDDVFKIILAILFPPLGVFFEVGCNQDLVINILLTILGYIPGIIHAIFIIMKY